MNKKVESLIKIIFSLITIFIVMSNIYIVKASDGDALLTKMEGQTKSFIDAGKANSSKINYQNISKEFKGLGQILTMFGGGVMVAVTTYMGIKYLTAGPEAQAKLKVQLIGVVVSGMVIFGAYYIWKIVIELAAEF